MARVFIGVGHGGSDPGAVAAGIKESEANLQMALGLKVELERHGVTVGISRTRDEEDRLAEEIDPLGQEASQAPGTGHRQLEAQLGIPQSQRAVLLHRRRVGDVEAVAAQRHKPGISGHIDGAQVAAPGPGHTQHLCLAKGLQHLGTALKEQARDRSIAPRMARMLLAALSMCAG